jgi:hypothetical protein
MLANFQKFLAVESFLSITMSPTDISGASYRVWTSLYDSHVNSKGNLVFIFEEIVVVNVGDGAIFW